jgi:hypothetical protein
MGFQEAFDNIKENIGDLTQLNVRTFTGEIDADVENLLEKGVTLEVFLKKANVNGKVKVVGFTDMKMDGDVDQFITSSPVTSAIAAHNSAIQAGQQSRKAMLEFFTDAIKKGIKAVT